MMVMMFVIVISVLIVVTALKRQFEEDLFRFQLKLSNIPVLLEVIQLDHVASILLDYNKLLIDLGHPDGIALVFFNVDEFLHFLVELEVSVFPGVTVVNGLVHYTVSADVDSLQDLVLFIVYLVYVQVFSLHHDG